MSAPKTFLFAGEELALVVRPHAIVLLKPALAPLAAIALTAAIPNRWTALVMLIVFLRFGWDVAQWYMDRYVLTSQRIISMSGVFTKKVASLPLGKITDLTYARSLIGRILGYGSLDLESAGQKDFDRIDFLPDPDHFYRATMSLALAPPASDGEADGAEEADELPDERPPQRPRLVSFDDTAQVPAVRRDARD
jgi:uncharacterized membrane protein YdbT with pleckstrin-like domain